MFHFEENDGFTLIEVMVSIILISIVLVPMFLLFSSARVFNTEDAERTQALGFATAIAQDIEMYKGSFTFITRLNTYQIQQFVAVPTTINQPNSGMIGQTGFDYSISETSNSPLEFEITVSFHGNRFGYDSLLAQTVQIVVT